MESTAARLVPRSFVGMGVRYLFDLSMWREEGGMLMMMWWWEGGEAWVTEMLLGGADGRSIGGLNTLV